MSTRRLPSWDAIRRAETVALSRRLKQVRDAVREPAEVGRNGVVFPRDHYERMGAKAAEYRRQERLLLGKPAWAIRRERERAARLLFGSSR